MRLLTIVVLLLGALSAPAVSSPGALRPEPIESPAPSFPGELVNADVNEGEALVVVSIGDDGTVLETWTARATHPAFRDAAEKALLSWRYPESIATGAPWPRSDLVRFRFERSGQIVSRTHAEAAASAFPNRRNTPFGQEIGRIPILRAADLRRISGVTPKSAGTTPGGVVVVEFILNETGAVLVPFALAFEDSEQAKTCVAAVRKWQFEPPKAGLGRVRWTFRFPGVKPAP